MSKSRDSKAAIDYMSLSFPSDRITLADIRRVHPDRFGTENGNFFELISPYDRSFTLDQILFLEHLLARAAFEKAAGLPGNVLIDVGLLQREECIEDLTGFYKTYGISQGQKHTKMLVRDLEKRAAKQASDRCR
jgi:hypothetical protein